MVINMVITKNQPENITLFAGAGFSRAVSEKVVYCDKISRKMPLANEMFKYSQTYLLNPDNEPNFKDYENLSKFLAIIYGKRVPDVSYEDAYQKLNDQRPDLKPILERLAFENLGVNWVPIRYPCEVNQTIEIIRRALAKNKINRIIATNPDLLIDVAIMGATEFDENFVALSGFDKSIIRCTEWLPVLEIKESIWGRLEKITQYVKIHGSINYVISKDNKLSVNDKYEWHRGITTNKYTREKEVENVYSLCVIPPSPEKKYDKDPWKSLFLEAQKVWDSTDKLIYYGFGFSEGDKNLTELFEKIKGTTEIIIFDKKAGEEKFKKRVKEEYLPNRKVEFNDNVETFF